MWESTNPVSEERVAEATKYLENAYAAAQACRAADIPFPVACALLEQETHGRNVYGTHDGPTAALSGFPGEVNYGNFAVFRWLVEERGFKSNGVGPCQITFYPHFDAMEREGLRPWVPRDNMLYGFSLLRDLYDRSDVSTWQMAAAYYNGGTEPDLEFGAEFAEKLKVWRERFKGL